MQEYSVAWMAKYPEFGELFDHACKSIVLIERADGAELSTCEHTFSVTQAGTSDSELFTSLVKRLEQYGTSNFTFYLEDFTGNKTNVWNHVIIGWDYRKVFGGVGSSLKLYSAENLALLHTEPKFKAHKVSSISATVSEIVVASGLTCEVQDSEGVPGEFELLHQCNVTDYTFICQHLIPRTVHGKRGGWKLFTTNGKDVRYARPDYQAVQATVDPVQVLEIQERAQTFEVGLQAANHYTGRAVDPELKEELDAESEGDIKKHGSQDPVWKVKQSLISPARSIRGLESFVIAHQRGLTHTNYPLIFILRGHQNVGKHPIKFPLIISLANGNDYREPSEHKGVAMMLIHEYLKGSTYRITAHCGRNSINN